MMPDPVEAQRKTRKEGSSRPPAVQAMRGRMPYDEDEDDMPSRAVNGAPVPMDVVA